MPVSTPFELIGRRIVQLLCFLWFCFNFTAPIPIKHSPPNATPRHQSRRSKRSRRTSHRQRRELRRLRRKNRAVRRATYRAAIYSYYESYNESVLQTPLRTPRLWLRLSCLLMTYPVLFNVLHYLYPPAWLKTPCSLILFCDNL